MSPNMFSLKWESYHKELSGGFANLQQSGEFVDMTLAAEGHLVKVHKNLICLASPYLKELVSSAPCAHPVVYLYNISHKVLSYLLEYIYIGEVEIPNAMLTSFIQACKALCIMGAKDIVETQTLPVTNEPQIDTNDRSDNFAAHITIQNDNYNLKVQSIKNDLIEDLQTTVTHTQAETAINDMPLLILQNGQQVGHNKNNDNLVTPNKIPSIDFTSIPTEFENSVQPIAYTGISVPEIDANLTSSGSFIVNEKNVIAEPVLQPTSANYPCNDPTLQATINQRFLDDYKILNKSKDDSLVNTSQDTLPEIAVGIKIDVPLQYSVSNRGAAQLILNRYIYYCHHQSFGHRKRRWRCIDYRKLHCQAYIDTDGDTIMSRKGLHNHTYHDNKILKKVKQKKMYASIPKIK